MTKAQLNAALRRSVPILLVATAVAIGVATRVHFLRHEMMSRWRGTLDGGALTTQATVDEWFTERTAEAEALAASVAIHAAFNHVGDPSPPFLTVLAPIVRGRKFTEGWGVIRRVSYGDALVPLDTEMSIEGAFLLAVLALGGLGAYGANRTVRVRRLYAQHEATVRLSTVVDAMCLADVVAATVRAMAPAIAEWRAGACGRSIARGVRACRPGWHRADRDERRQQCRAGVWARRRGVGDDAMWERRVRAGGGRTRAPGFRRRCYPESSIPSSRPSRRARGRVSACP